MKIKITIDARMLLSSGIGTVLSNIIPRIILKRPQWNFLLLGNPAHFREFSWASANNVSLAPYTAPIYSIKEQFYWPSREVRGSNLVWSPNYNFSLRWSGRQIVTVHDLAHLALPEIYGGLIKSNYAKLMFKLVRDRATGVVFISRFSEQEFRNRIGNTKALTSVVHCGVDTEWKSIPAAPSPHKKPFILFVGNIKPHKNLSRLLDAFEKIKTEIPHDLLIIGKKDGFITGDVRIADKVSRFEGRVTFTGYVEQALLKQMFAHASALVLPSFYEGFGLPPLEAMAAGCPTLVARAASMPEVCADAALYCDPFNVEDIALALKKLLTDDNLRQQLQKKGKERAHQFDWDRAAEGYLNMMEKLLAV